MKFIQSHFVERNAENLCQPLSSITQGSQETATQFVYLAMSLRKKLIVLSKSPAAEIKYDQEGSCSKAVPLKKAKKEVRDHRGEQKDKYMCKRCLEDDEEVCTHCFKCCGEGHIARKCPSSQ